MSSCCKERPNYGTPQCLENIGATVRVYFQKKYSDNGELNKTLLTDIETGIIDQWLNGTGVGDKMYPTGSLRNVTYELSDTLFEESSSGVKSFIREGIRTLTGELWDDAGNNVIKSKLESKRCDKWTFYIITAQNQIVGEKYVEDGVEYFKGIDISAQSIDPRFMFPTDTTTQKTMLSFDFDIYTEDGNFYSITGKEMWNDSLGEVGSVDFINPKYTYIDVDIKITNITSTVITVEINDAYRNGSKYPASINPKGNVTGLLLASFSVLNKTTQLPVVPASVDEITSGEYEITIAAQTANDSGSISIDQSGDTTKKIKYEGSRDFLFA